ncbi:MAG TPA: hypothetical protein VMF86_14035 [Stellaceae bacterium]|nr:hypothetical protein [Stellaceae bacterium]
MMAASSKLMIGEAERRFPVRLRIAVPSGGIGERLDRTQRRLDENAGSDGWAMTPAGIRGVVNDAIAVYFRDPAIAGAFVARWCKGGEAELVDGVLQVRDDTPGARVAAAAHKTL